MDEKMFSCWVLIVMGYLCVRHWMAMRPPKVEGMSFWPIVTGRSGEEDSRCRSD